MIDGSRHERAALVGTAYIIGFVTAFIGYGVSNLSTPTMPVESGSEMSAALLKAVPASGGAMVEERTEGLYIVNGEKETLLSVNEASTDSVVAQDGVYARLSKYELSPDGRYVYFCEQPSANSDSCAPYVYSVEKDVVYPVTQDGNRIGVASDRHEVVWTRNGLVSIEGVLVDVIE